MRSWADFLNLRVFRQLQVKKTGTIVTENSDGTLSTLTATQFGAVGGVTPGTALASKALILDSSKGISTITSATITTLTAPTVTSTASTQGAALAVSGGTSSTSANAGGAVTIVGGSPGLTGIGGAVSATGAAGGATSGAGGAVSAVGGAGTAGNAAGGAVAVTGGAGQGSAAGGAVNITTGAAGATGVAGALAIAVGAATAGNGSSMTLTGGNGAGSTNAGGNVNLVGGTAVSTGIPGEVQVNGNAGLLPVTLTSIGVLEVVTRCVFVCSRPMRLKSVSLAYGVASTSGTMTVEKLTGTTAPGSGTALLTGTISMSSTANTVNAGTLIATVASITFATGDRVGFVFAGTVTNLVGFAATAMFVPT